VVGAGNFGVVTRVTLKTHEMPKLVGGVSMAIRAASDAAFRRLIGRFVSFYKEGLFNPHWGEEVHLQPDNTFDVAMAFQRLDQPQARAVWLPFLDWVSGSPQDFTTTSPTAIVALPARDYWDGEYLRTHFPKAYLADDRPDAPRGNVWSAGDAPEASQFMHGHASAWLPASLLNEDQQQRLVDALFASSRHWAVGLHCNKGLAGGPADPVAATRDTAMNPAALEAFALAICAARSVMSFPNIRGHEPDLAVARQQAVSVEKAINEMFRVAPAWGAYVSEDNYFQKNWQQAYWGPNYLRLVAVKKKYDPAGLVFVHHGIGSEEWTADGFTRLDAR
jgi:FAD/FMN-containing dehydrogenase